MQGAGVDFRRFVATRLCGRLGVGVWCLLNRKEPLAGIPARGSFVLQAFFWLRVIRAPVGYHTLTGASSFTHTSGMRERRRAIQVESEMAMNTTIRMPMPTT